MSESYSNLKQVLILSPLLKVTPATRMKTLHSQRLLKLKSVSFVETIGILSTTVQLGRLRLGDVAQSAIMSFHDLCYSSFF